MTAVSLCKTSLLVYLRHKKNPFLPQHMSRSTRRDQPFEPLRLSLPSRCVRFVSRQVLFHTDDFPDPVRLVHRASISPRPTLSQNLLSLQTLPTPRLSSPLLLSSTVSLHLRSHTLPTHRLNPSLTRSLSTARVLATSAGATRPCTYSPGSTLRATSASGGGRTARRRDSRIAVSERASLRLTTVVLVRKTRRAISSLRLGREGEVRRGGSTARA